MRNIYKTSHLLIFIIIVKIQCDIVKIINNRWQIQPIYAMAYSDYTNIQIFQLLNWKINDKMIQSINQHNYTFKVAHNQFSYLSHQEIQQKYLNLGINSNIIKVTSPSLIKEVKDKNNTSQIIEYQKKNQQVIDIDWRQKLTTPVKRQGQCGACWAFTAIADVQSYYIKKYGVIHDFSQQQLIDCSSLYGNYGCAGGMMDNAFRYIIKYGITLESAYPYERKINKCKYDKRYMPSFSISSSKIIFNSCESMINILKDRPLSVIVSVHPSFVFYSKGIINICGEKANHSLQLAGLKKNYYQSYYIAKNSWGIEWGDKGYAYFDASINQGNICSICSYPQIPS